VNDVGERPLNVLHDWEMPSAEVVDRAERRLRDHEATTTASPDARSGAIELVARDGERRICVARSHLASANPTTTLCQVARRDSTALMIVDLRYCDAHRDYGLGVRAESAGLAEESGATTSRDSKK